MSVMFSFLCAARLTNLSTPEALLRLLPCVLSISSVTQWLIKVAGQGNAALLVKPLMKSARGLTGEISMARANTTRSEG